MLPKRVGLPSASAAQSRRSSSVAYGGPLPGISSSTASATVDTRGTVRTLASNPPASSIPRATCRASSAVAPPWL